MLQQLFVMAAIFGHITSTLKVHLIKLFKTDYFVFGFKVKRNELPNCLRHAYENLVTDLSLEAPVLPLPDNGYYKTKPNIPQRSKCCTSALRLVSRQRRNASEYKRTRVVDILVVHDKRIKSLLDRRRLAKNKPFSTPYKLSLVLCD